MKFSACCIIILWITADLSCGLTTNGPNVCSSLVRYTESYQVRTQYYEVTTYSTCCAKFLWCWNSCRKSRRILRYKMTVQTRTKYRSVYRCCGGYKEINNKCEPTCNAGCLHGRCVAPNKCSCYAGFTGITCSNDINECLTNSNKCDQICRNTRGSYVCSCQLGYTQSSTDQHKCLNLDECKLASSLCMCADKNNNPGCIAECVDTQGSYMCRCSQGYSLLYNSRICTDLDECRTGVHKCEQICRNTAGSYTCSCEPGFKLNDDGRNCTNINECSVSNGGCEYTCQDTIGSYRCQCPSGMTMDENGRTCSYVNQCLESTHGCQHKCVNERSHYRCACNQGYQLNTDNKTCSDENECETGHHQCSDICVNTIGNYTCKCKDGFQLDSDGKKCVDINECKNIETNPCSHICINTPGSYQCFCREGYQLKVDNHTCTGIPCQDMAPLHHGNATCLTGVTDDTCSFQCSKGFSLKGSKQRTCGIEHKWNGTITSCNRRSCQSINAPVYGSISLPCANIYNSECEVSCIEGYYVVGNKYNNTIRKCSVNEADDMVWSNDQMVCKKSEACLPNPCKHGGSCMMEGSTSFSCDCYSTGYIGETCQIGVVEVAQIPILSINQERKLKISARPDKSLNIQISSSSKSLKVEPENFTLTNNKPEFSIRINGTLSGYFKLSFRLSGDSAEDFKTPKNTVIFVDGNYSIPGIPSPVKPDGSLKTGCFENSLESSKVSFTSSMKWSEGETFGVLQVVDQTGNSMPLSFSGGRLMKNTDENSEMVEVFDINKVTESTDGNVEKDKECFSSFTPSQYAGTLLKTNAFLYAIQNLFNTNSPYWFKIYAKLHENDYELSDLGGALFKGSELNSKPSICTKGFAFNATALYYIYTTKKTFYVLLPHKNITLPSTYTKCFIKNMETTEVRFVYSKQRTIEGLDEKNLLSNEVAKLLGVNGSVDRIGFKINDYGNDIIEGYGKQAITFKDSSENTFLQMNIEGIYKWNVENANNVFDEDFTKTFTADHGEVDVNINWYSLGNLQRIHLQGDLLYMLRSSSNGILLTTTSILPKNVTLSKDLDEMVQFQAGKEFKLSIKTTGSTSIISIDENTKVKLKNIALSTGGVHVAKNFLENYKVNSNYGKYTHNETTELMGKLNQILTLSNQLFTELDQITVAAVKKIITTVVTTRTLYLDSIKRFQVLLDAHLRSDFFDQTGMETEFMKFQLIVDHIMERNFEFDYIDSTNTALFHSFSLQTNAKVCLKTICLENHAIDLSYQPTSSDQGVIERTLIRMTLNEDMQLGGLINIPDTKNILITLSKQFKNFTAIFNGTIRFYGQDVSIQPIIDDRELRFQENVKFLGDGVLLNAIGSLSSMNVDDPILLILTVNGDSHSATNKILQDIKTSIDNRITRENNNLQKRYQVNQDTHNRLAIDLRNVTTKVKVKREQLILLQKSITDLKRNASRVKSMAQTAKQKLSQLIKDEAETARSLLDECKPQLCNLTCIPGIVITPCQQNLTRHTLEQKCSFEEVDKEIFEIVRVIKQERYRDFDVKSSCNDKCTGLVGFFKGIFGKRRKKRGIVTTVVKLAGKIIIGKVTDKVTEALEEYGGPYSKVGALIGGVVAGPIGEIVGAGIGVVVKHVIGGCNTQCRNVYIPKLVTISTSKIERRPKTIKQNESSCYNEQKIVNIGYGVMEECIDFNNNCSDVIVDSQCLQRNEKCAEFELAMKKSATGPSNEVNNTFMEYKKYSITLKLLETLLQQQENQYNNLQRKLQIDSAFMARLQNSHQEANAAFIKLNNSINIWNKVTNRRERLSSTLFTYNFTIGYTRGMKLPQRIAVDFRGFDVTITSLFDMSNYKGSIHDAAKKIVTEMKVEEGGTPYERKKRSVEDQGEQKPSLSQLQEKCLTIEKAILFSIDILENIKETITAYKNRTLMFHTIKNRASQDKQDLVQKINTETRNIVSNESNMIEMHDIISNIGKEDIDEDDFRSWNETLNNALLEFFNTSFSEECFSLTDCISYHFQEVDNIIKFENNSQSVLSLFVSLRRSLYTLTESYPKISLAESIIDEAFTKVKMINPIELFCGERPLVKISLHGKIHLKENEELKIVMEMGESHHEVEFQWKVNNTIISDEYNAILKRKVTKKDSGYYSCQATNKFGTSYCGSVEVIVYKKPVFLEQPTAVETYIHSPTPTYLYCNVSEMNDEFEYSWSYQSFQNLNATEEIPYANQTFLLVPNHSEDLSGYYFCTVKTRMHTVESKKARVNILSASVPVESFKVTMGLSEVSKNHSREKRNTEKDAVLSKIANTMLLNNSDIHDFENNIFADKTNKTLSFILKGTNFTEHIHNGESWNDVSRMKIKDRNDMLLRTVLLYQAAQNTTFLVQINSKDFNIVADSIQAEPVQMSCPIGQVVLENGFMCGDCPAGSRYDEEEFECRPCQKDSYQPATKQSSCISCPDGFITQSDGSVTILECVEEVKTTPFTTTPLSEAKTTPGQTEPTSETDTTPTPMTSTTPTPTNGNKPTTDRTPKNGEKKVATEDDEQWKTIVIAVVITVIIIIIVLVIVCLRKRSNNSTSSKNNNHRNKIDDQNEFEFTNKAYTGAESGHEFVNMIYDMNPTSSDKLDSESFPKGEKKTSVVMNSNIYEETSVPPPLPSRTAVNDDQQCESHYDNPTPLIGTHTQIPRDDSESHYRNVSIAGAPYSGKLMQPTALRALSESDA